jgi:hypothetical protein
MSEQIKYSSELMTNYVHASVVSPLNNFLALQSAQGHSLLFAVGTNNAFNVITEESGISTTGWKNIDLSTAQLAKDFIGQPNVICKTFGAAQNAADGSIGIGMVVGGGVAPNDTLYLSLGNSNSNLDWLENPQWTAFPYDNANTSISFKGVLSIQNVFVTENNNGQYIVVDVLRDSNSPVKDIRRFTIDPTKTNGTAWLESDLPIDIEADNYSSSLGCITSNSPIEGLYTLGKAGTCNQIVFTPVINWWGQGPVNPTLLYLPTGLMGDAMASVRASGTNTDLYVTSNNGLYYFSAAAQAAITPTAPCVGTLIQTNSLFHDVKSLFAYQNNGSVYICGINNANQVFYTNCSEGNQAIASAWSVPFPIVSQVDLLSPYVNVVSGGNTFFAVDTDGFYKMTQSPQTTIWKKQHMHLPAPSATSPAISFSSYTTRVDMTDENNQPLSNATININTNTRAAFYINNLYYVLDTQPIPITTDSLGGLTIIESVKSLSGTPITLTSNGGTTVTINPMDTPMNKIATLDTKEKVQQANITYQNVNTKQLVSSTATDNQLAAIAQSNVALAKAYNKVTQNKGQPAAMRMVSMAAPSLVANSIISDIGDIFQAIENDVDSIVEIVEDVANDVYYFVATIAGKVYSAVLDCAEKVAAAIEYVYNAVKTAIEDIINFLKFLFDLADLKRTKQVIKNVINVFIKNEIEAIKDYKTDFDSFIGNLEQKFNDLLVSTPSIGADGDTNVNTVSNPTQHQSSPSTLLSHHLNANIGNATVIKAITSAPTNDPTNVIDVLTNLIEGEEGAFMKTVEKIIDVIKNANNMTVIDIVKQLLAAIGDFVFDTIKNVVDAVFDVVIIVFNLIFDLLNEEFHIPVVSDILAEFGLEIPSIIDILSWVTAVPSTLLYKIMFNESPFPDDAITNKYLNATKLADFAPTPNTTTQAAMPVAQSRMAVEPVRAELAVTGSATKKTPTEEDKRAFRTWHIISAVAAILNAPVSVVDALDPNPANEEGKASAFWSILSGATWGLASVFEPQAPVKDAGFSIASKVFLALRIGNLVITSGKVPKIAQHRKIGSIIDAVIGVANLVISIEHFVELGKDDSSNEKTLAILDETSFLFGYIARWGYCATVCVENPYVKAGGATAVAVGNLGYAGLQIAEAAAYDQ